ncbi:transcriptional regulator, LacI family [Sanguibacter gelidistatuariae]|uniref:Transcriptional regulator, LacI family n=1 Tax=Sanguibacter gelidistatuariae TaxID=1814289 RepID=A0A1G6VI43_9MICO|nr:LacI family DNA-binding transcriptional regulator [Sanguibacter gelidistatuariae]SDD53229.1 transcriptional regulator, LacI family [Sanguibacter gelidistatuariae]
MTSTAASSSPPARPAPALGSQRVTLSAVATLAGVSMATVSKVINGRTGVGPDTRVRVEAAIDELGYVSLGERQSSLHAAHEMSIELMVDPRDVTNPYLATFLGGAMEAAAELRVALVLRSIDWTTERKPVAWAQDLARAGRAGVIEVTNAYSAERERALVRAGIPMVLVDPIDVPRTSTPSIGATNWAGAYAATEHLIGLGHERIRYVGGPAGARCDIVRAHGWAAAMNEHGLDVADVPRHSYTFEHGLRAATEMLTGPDRPTAIFAGSDASATGVLEAARRLGLSVPDSLSVVGFDDTLLSQMSAPPLTTVHQPIADIGRAAVSTVIRLARGDMLSTKRVELSTHLVVRDSTAPPQR